MKPVLYDEYVPVVVGHGHTRMDLEAVFRNRATNKLEIWKRVVDETEQSIHYRSWNFEFSHEAMIEDLGEHDLELTDKGVCIVFKEDQKSDETTEIGNK